MQTQKHNIVQGRADTIKTCWVGWSVHFSLFTSFCKIYWNSPLLWNHWASDGNSVSLSGKTLLYNWFLYNNVWMKIISRKMVCVKRREIRYTNWFHRNQANIIYRGIKVTIRMKKLTLFYSQKNCQPRARSIFWVSNSFTDVIAWMLHLMEGKQLELKTIWLPQT